MAESENKNSPPPAVPAKEPIDKQEKPDTATKSTTKPDPQSDTKPKIAPAPSSNDEMAGGSSQGQIPLDDMRAKSGIYKDAVTGFEEKEMGSPARSKSKARSISEKDVEGRKDMDTDRDMMMDLDPTASTSVLDLSSMEMFGDALTHQETSAKKSALSPTVEEDEQEDLPAGYDKPSFSRRKDPNSKMHEENTRLRRHAQDLSRKINILITEKQIAEEKAERATERISEMKQTMNSGMTDIERDTESLARDLERAREENRALREQLNDAQSHIFSLQPYRKDQTSEEIGREYDTLVEQIQDWVQKFMDPWLEDHAEGVEGIMTIARKRTQDANKFKRALHQYPDLVHASSYPETDEDIIASIILRYLHDNIFQAILYSDIPKYTEVVSFIENSMQMSVEPKRDLFSVRTWTAEAYNALLSSPPFRSVRDRRRKEMTVELCGILKVFCKKEKMSWFYEQMDDNCVFPAMKLYEKLQVSTHHFYLDINPYIMWSSGGDLNASPEFIDSIKNLDCRNVLQNRKAFNLAKLDPPPSKKELYHRLLNVCTVVPSLHMRQIGQRDSIKEPIVVRKQQMLVAWGDEDKRRAFIEKGERTIVSHLFHAKSERAPEGWTAQFRWGG
ncbi:hypothetical protein EDB81DRAFT_788456 [Dactylonectria macrodidyma]|uniref:Uncharacterized protein n=1 Tax=Dactylonectria macrodidyma TaxID=307937 RepID=A0A9P9FBR9_9HYPO|nr:hypothetical protein EDB81DRAFT_788456 [Dactylonectria macrodidyma]